MTKVIKIEPLLRKLMFADMSFFNKSTYMILFGINLVIGLKLLQFIYILHEEHVVCPFHIGSCVYFISDG